MNYKFKFEKSDYKRKLINFIERYVLKKFYKPVILEFGVRKGISTRIFINYCNQYGGQLISVDVNNCKEVTKDRKWTFIQSRDDDFEYLSKQIPKKIDIIHLDSLHTANHVEKILYYYYKKLKVNGLFVIDDVSWIPYLQNKKKNSFGNELANLETFKRILEIFSSNTDRFDLDFSFINSGLGIIKKNNLKKLNLKDPTQSRQYSVKNLFRKIYYFLK
jgi:predicted O-methyltransferase YrrM